jgi:hypothetical protein
MIPACSACKCDAAQWAARAGNKERAAGAPGGLGRSSRGDADADLFVAEWSRECKGPAAACVRVGEDLYPSPTPNVMYGFRQYPLSYALVVQRPNPYTPCHL